MPGDPNLPAHGAAIPMDITLVRAAIAPIPLNVPAIGVTGSAVAADIAAQIAGTRAIRAIQAIAAPELPAVAVNIAGLSVALANVAMDIPGIPANVAMVAADVPALLADCAVLRRRGGRLGPAAHGTEADRGQSQQTSFEETSYPHLSYPSLGQWPIGLHPVEHATGGKVVGRTRWRCAVCATGHGSQGTGRAAGWKRPGNARSPGGEGCRGFLVERA